MRIALLSVDGRVRQWHLSAVQAAASASTAESPLRLELMMLRPAHAQRTEEGLWPLVRAVEQRLLGPRPSLWRHVAVNREYDAAGSSGSFTVAEASEAEPPDLVLDCTGLEGTDAWAARAQLGLLRVRFGDALDGTGIDRALVPSQPWVRISVELVTPEQTHPIETTVMTLVTARLFSRAREGAARRARQLLIRAMTRLHQDRGSVAAAPADSGSTELEPPPRQDPPVPLSGRQGLARLIKNGVSLAYTAARSTVLHADHWFLAYRTRQDKFIANTFEMSRDGLQIFHLDPTRFYADPCVFEHEGEVHVFFEEFPYKRKKGVISWSQLQNDGKLSQPTVVLEEPTHLSYPFVFSYQGAVYMVPETTRRREIAIFEAFDFPCRWRKASVLFENTAGCDATLHVHDDRWWMFVNIRHDGFSGSDELFLFHAQSPFGPWTAHRRNPIKSDVRSARPAGRLFYRDDRLIRPAQDRSGSYGGALLLCEVQELTTTTYRETIVKKLDPGWLPGNRGLHTLSFSSRLEVIDGKRDLPRWRIRAGREAVPGS